MKNEQILNDLDKAGEALRAMGEDAIYLSWHKADHLIDHDRFAVGVQSRAYGPTIWGHGDTPSKALCHALAKRSEKEADAAIEARIRAEVEAEVQAKAA